MLTKMVELVPIAALLLTAMFWSYAPSSDLPLRLVAGLGAGLNESL